MKNSMLRSTDEVRINYILKYCSTGNKKRLDNISILDIGCGEGHLSEALQRCGARVVGIDSCSTAIDAFNCKMQHLDSGSGAKSLVCNFVESDISNVGKFDVILLMDVLEHVPFADVIKKVEPLLMPGGKIIISTINKTFIAWFFAILLAEYVFGWIERDTHQVENFIDPSELAGILADSGLFVQNCSGMLPNMSGKWKLSDFTQMNYIMIAKKQP